MRMLSCNALALVFGDCVVVALDPDCPELHAAAARATAATPAASREPIEREVVLMTTPLYIYNEFYMLIQDWDLGQHWKATNGGMLARAAGSTVS
ncbi:MAG: hypothetical protein JOZ09_03355 [Pseudonocardiales bacterium]|nr:hypothetical protein [Pseudonocardiales bacterium]